MDTPEDIERQIELMKQQMEAQIKKMEELKKKKEELSKPISAWVENILFTGIGGMFEVKLSRYDEAIVNRLRTVPSRRYITAREVNVFDLDTYDRVVYELKECNVDLVIDDEKKEKIKEWKQSPDFRISLFDRRNQIRIDKTIKRKSLQYIYQLSTWTYHSLHEYWTFSITELLEWMKIQAAYKDLNFEMTDEVKALYEEQVEREKLLDQFADMKDAPEIDFTFKWTDSNGIETVYNLKPDQRVACKFDDTFNHRTLLSFDMGKGKTAIALAQAERHNERVLFICKADLKTNIKREVRKFTGKEATVFSGATPDGLDVDLMIIKKQQYNILNYDVVGRETKSNPEEPGIMKWVELINAAGFDRIIYDEAHYMKNMETLRSRGGRALKAPKVMLLTGTPIVNRPGELFPILNIIDNKTFSDYNVFLRQFTTDGTHPKNLDQLHKLLKKYMIRRTRDNSLDPNRITQYHTLSSEAKTRYNDVLNGVYTSLRNPDHKANVTNILTELLRCKQICADDKVDFTVDLAETALDETVDMPWNKVLIFSQFKATQGYIAQRLGSKAAIINGDVTDKMRYDLVDKFQDPKSDLKVIVTNIVEGLTLTNAFTVIINDLWWTPKDHTQAEGRAFGRENDPHGGNAYYILAEDTIDDMIWLLLEKKLNIARSIVDDVYVKVEGDESLLSELIKMLRGR